MSLITSSMAKSFLILFACILVFTAPLRAQSEAEWNAFINALNSGDLGDGNADIGQADIDAINMHSAGELNEQPLGLSAEEIEELGSLGGDSDGDSPFNSDEFNSSNEKDMLDTVNGIMHKDLGEESLRGFLSKNFNQFNVPQFRKLLSGKVVQIAAKRTFSVRSAGLVARRGTQFRMALTSKGLFISPKGKKAPLLMMRALAGNKGYAVANVRTRKVSKVTKASMTGRRSRKGLSRMKKR